MRRAILSFAACLSLLTLAGVVRAAEWEAVTTELLRTEKPGFGGLSGVAVDHQTGAVYIDLSDKGVYRSTDQCKSWQRFGSAFKGRTETPGCLLLDPVGKSKRLLAATVYGGPVALFDGEDWKFLDKKFTHVDWCALDWGDPAPKLVLALKHESGGVLLVGHGDKEVKEAGKGFGPAWVFDDRTAVVAETKTKDRPKPGLLRTTDGGTTFKPCGDHAAQALPKWRDGVLYWLTDGGIITTADRGETWKQLCVLKDGRYGPVFGKDAKQLLVLTKDGVVESDDGGANWSATRALPKDLKGVGPGAWLEYDPENDVLYVMKMGSELFRMSRGR
jgi:hypothetical protein